MKFRDSVLTETTTRADLLDLAERALNVSIAPRPDCRLWPSPGRDGYGVIRFGGRSIMLHRLIWESVHGPISDDLTVDHLCRVRACLNTEHMELVTLAENARRAAGHPRFTLAAKSGRGWRGTRAPAPPLKACRNGHDYEPGSYKLEPSGTRRCLICRREVERKRDRSDRIRTKSQNT